MIMRYLDVVCFREDIQNIHLIIEKMPKLVNKNALTKEHL